MKDVDKLLNNAYKRYCGSEDHCYYAKCQINSLMLNMNIHVHEKDVALIYGDYKVLEWLGR